MNNEKILSVARQTLDQGLYFGSGRITRAIDSELLAFARNIEYETINTAIEWLRNNYQEYPNIDSVCDAMLAHREVQS
jgi:predicted DNA-binding protein (UPF0278 family)